MTACSCMSSTATAHRPRADDETRLRAPSKFCPTHPKPHLLFFYCNCFPYTCSLLSNYVYFSPSSSVKPGFLVMLSLQLSIALLQTPLPSFPCDCPSERRPGSAGSGSYCTTRYASRSTFLRSYLGLCNPCNRSHCPLYMHICPVQPPSSKNPTTILGSQPYPTSSSNAGTQTIHQPG
jgi:hypothetical protein